MAAAADASRDDEVGDAIAAFTGFVEALRQLVADLDADPASRAHRNVAKLMAAQTSLLRHAESVVSAYAFVDGQPVKTPDAGLLTAFYTSSNDASASRYCWALLHFEAPLQLQQFIAATEVEHGEFRRRHAGTAEGGSAPLNLHAEQADRLSYWLAVLQRTMLVQRSLLPVTDTVSVGVAFLTNAVAEADDALQAMRIKALKVGRNARKNIPEGGPGSTGDGS